MLNKLRIHTCYPLYVAVTLVLLSVVTPAAVAQSVPAGPYRVSVATSPVVVPTGPASLRIYITNADNRPAAGLTVTARAQMPGMPMGEQFENASPQVNVPGLYVAPATFGMAGLYNATVRMNGPAGAATATVRLVTGRSTSGNLPVPVSSAQFSSQSGRPLPWKWLVATFVVLAVLVIAGRNVALRQQLKRLALPVVVLAIALIASRWVIARFTPPGHMSVLDAQAMDMSGVSMPVGQWPVSTETATIVNTAGTEDLSATVVPYTDQTISARVPGTIISLPVYAGQQVVPGQLLVALGDRQYSADLQSKAAAVQMALHDVMIAKLNLHQANQQVLQAQAGTTEAASQLAGAKLALTGSLAQVTAARQQLAATKADVTSAQAQVAYSSALLSRDRVLLKGGSISLQEFQKDEASSRTDEAKVAEQNAAVLQARAMLAAAVASAAQARQNLVTLQAALQQATANQQAVQDGASTMRHEIIHKQAAVTMATADEKSAAAVAGYTRITATIRGAVLQRLVGPGMLIQPGQPLLQIAEIDKVRVQAQVPVEELDQLHVGSAVKIETGSNAAAINGSITSIFPYADPASRTATIEAVVSNIHEQLVPGQFVNMKVSVGQVVAAVLVPVHALIQIPVANSVVSSNRTIPAVWVMTNKGQAHLAHVTTGPTVGDKVAIISGLKRGDNVIVEGIQGLQEGMPVVRTPWANGAPITLPDPSEQRPEGAIDTVNNQTKVPGAMAGMRGMGGMSK